MKKIYLQQGVLENSSTFSFRQNSVWEKKSLIEENEIISNDENAVQVLNTFFPNIVDSFNFPEYVTNDPISDNISDPIIRLTVK